MSTLAVFARKQSRRPSGLITGTISSAYARREVLQAAAPAASLTPAQTDLTELSATEAVAQLCSRTITAVDYVQALFARLDAGWSCINSFQTLNRTRVRLTFCPFFATSQWPVWTFIE